MRKFRVVDRHAPCYGRTGDCIETADGFNYFRLNLGELGLWWFNKDQVEKVFETDSKYEIGGFDVKGFDSSLKGRKKNKQKAELFEYGFPLATKEIIKVMTWAAESKGYLPHDWKNIPDPNNQLQAAAARHRLERLSGVENDHESCLLHLAHEAFNILALLELKLSKKDGEAE